MKLLYITLNNQFSASGGAICRKSNEIALQNIDLDYSEYLIPLTNKKIDKIISTLRGYKCGLSRYHIKAIKNKILSENIEIVFIEPSLYGRLIKVIYKETDAKIITFFQNCEYEIYKQSINKRFILLPLLWSVYLNELYSLKYSRKCIFLTERDYTDCKKKYGLNIQPFFSPIALENKYSYTKPIFFKKPRNLLFVGSYFYPNIHGVIWFINNVLSHTKYKLTIVGKGFEKTEFIKFLKSTEKVTIKGYVESIDLEYELADIVVQPVFEGSGMKTKTAECFMYGKPLISSSEGLVGYFKDLQYVYECNTANDFIKVLNDLYDKEIPSFCNNLRKIFKDNYSVEARIENYKKLFAEL